MAEYRAVKGGKLKLKGGAAASSLLGKKKKTKRKKVNEQEEWMKEPGAMRHGKLKDFLHVCLIISVYMYELVSLKHAVSSYLYLSRDACNYYCFLLSLKLVT